MHALALIAKNCYRKFMLKIECDISNIFATAQVKFCQNNIYFLFFWHTLVLIAKNWQKIVSRAIANIFDTLHAYFQKHFF